MLQHVPSLSNAPVRVCATLGVCATLLVLAAATVGYRIHSHNICTIFNGRIDGVLGVRPLLGLKLRGSMLGYGKEHTRAVCSIWIDAGVVDCTMMHLFIRHGVGFRKGGRWAYPHECKARAFDAAVFKLSTDHRRWHVSLT